jgi:hypothetical protein
LSRSQESRDIGLTLSLQSIGHSEPIRERPVLAHLPLSLQVPDFQPKTDDPTHQGSDEFFGRIGRSPRCWSARLMGVGELRYVLAGVLGIVDEFERPVCMDRNIVPSRNDPLGLALAWIPGWSDVGVGAEEDRHRVVDRATRLRIRSSERIVAKGVAYMASLPLAANVQFMTVIATKMPYIGRG